MGHIHEKLPKGTIAKGGTYTVKYSGEPIYEAKITEFGGGCWATLEITKPLTTKFDYKAGNSFEIKVAMYEFD